MDLQQSKKILDKINALYQSISVEEDHISSIEKDLMLSYIRQLYESFLETKPETLSAPARKAIKKAKIKKTPPSSPQPAEPAPAPVKQSAPEPVLEVSPPAPEPEPEAEPAPAPEPKVEKKPVAKTPPPSKVKATPLGKFKTLFENKGANELSEKLSLQPISDITKSIAINDKLLYVNDLFGKDANAYAVTLNQLNSLGNMDEASNVLLEFAKSNDWLDDEKQDTARAFIKLVRRRYI
ncbi:MAG: hypothetical protein DWQ02_22300 [Bacteroidetes bacterium]|nr:MAG: hypothetical protein DWQ02_22300 [Bacteroidota bacterium]